MPAQIEIRKASTKGAARRRIAFQSETEASQALYHIKSRTVEGESYDPAIDLQTGHVFCSCKHFQFRCTYSRLGHTPNVADVEKLCHHLQRAVVNRHRIMTHVGVKSA